MSSLMFTIFYILVSVCFIFPNSEFVSAGFTIQYLFANWLGSEHEHFIMYHIRRTTATVLCHSLLPFGYLLGLCCLQYSDPKSIFWEGGNAWQLFVISTVVLPVITMSIVWTWWRGNWKNHPIARTLTLLANQNQFWTEVASDINIEFRRIDKFCLETSTLVKVIATDNWVLKVSPYTVHCAHQSDTALILSASDSHGVAPGGPGGAQFLTIEVTSTRPGMKPFTIRLDSMDFRDLQDKVSRPITVLQNVTFHQTLSDRFLEAFREQVAENAVYETNEELEHCIGCMQVISNVKLQKHCSDPTPGDDPCSNCYCRPMWCIDCMGKWFASRQDQNHSENWLACKCTCPLCRSRFCMLDICQISPR